MLFTLKLTTKSTSPSIKPITLLFIRFCGKVPRDVEAGKDEFTGEVALAIAGTGDGASWAWKVVAEGTWIDTGAGDEDDGAETGFVWRDRNDVTEEPPSCDG